MVTVRRDAIGRYFVSFVVDEAIAPLPEAYAAVGIDVGLRSAAQLSDGTKVEAPRYLRRRLRIVAGRARTMARRKKGSRRRDRARVALARTHARVADARRDWLHKLSSKLVRENQTLVVEDLNLRGMTRNRRLALSLADGAIGELYRQLEYKAAWDGRAFVRVGRFFPSTKRCFTCCHVLEQLPLAAREWTCPECGSAHDRDVNAARNLLDEGLRTNALPPGGREARRVEGAHPRPFAGRPLKRESLELEARS
jgi:putative transposase